MRSSTLFAIAASFSATSAVFQGFNYGSTQTDGSIKDEATFEAEFKTAQDLAGTNGAFASARLYTTIQGGTTADPISAIQAAINTNTTLLLGIWASSGQTVVDNEISALKAAITTYGTKFTSLVAGISVGSEDLYRISPTGILNKSNPGADPGVLVNYIKAVRSAIAGTSLSGAKIGHVDTWTAWVNGSNAEVITNCDWLGVDAYPYFQNTESNGIDNGATLLFDAYDATTAVAGGKEVWITETGWPVSGKTENLAVPNTANAKTYWDQVGCAKAFGKINTWWFTLQDSNPTTPDPSFGIIGSTLTTTPLFDLSCAGVSSESSSAGSKNQATASASAGSSASSTVTGGNAAVTNPSTASGSGSGVAGTGTASTGMATSTVTSNGTAPTAGSPTASSSSTPSSNSAASMSLHSGSFLGGALGGVFAIAALL